MKRYIKKVLEEWRNDGGMSIYQFLKEALIRKFGAEWYDQLEMYAKERK